MRFKAALIVLLLAVCSTEAVACVVPPRNACDAPLPPPPFSIPLEVLQGHSVAILVAGLVLLLSAGLIIGSTRFSRLQKAAYAVLSIAVSHLCIHASILMQVGLFTSCGCRAAEPFLPLKTIFGNPAFNVVLAVVVLTIAGLVRALANSRESEPAELH